MSDDLPHELVEEEYDLGCYLLVCQHCQKAGTAWRERKPTHEGFELLDDSDDPLPDDEWRIEAEDHFSRLEMDADTVTIRCRQCRSIAEAIPWDALKPLLERNPEPQPGPMPGDISGPLR